MSSDLMVHELFRALESTIHERLNMIEDVIRLTRSKPHESGQEIESDRIRVLEAELATMSSRLAALEMADGVSEAESVPIVHVNHVGSQGETLVAPASSPIIKSEIWIEPMKGLEINLADTPATAAPVPPVVVAVPVTPVKPVAQPVVPATPTKPVRPEPTPVARVEPKKLIPEPEPEVEEEEEVEVADEEEQEVVSGDEAEAVEEEEAEEAQESEAEEEEEADEDEAALELEAFEYKGKTYYKDQNNQVYVPNPDDPEDVNETPVGVWSDERQRVLFKRA